MTEGIRSEGGHLVNAKGERFVNELDTRDVVSSSIIRECEEGRGIRTMSGRVGVWLDTPLLDAEHGPGTVEKHFPAMMLQYERFGIDISKDPVLDLSDAALSERRREDRYEFGNQREESLRGRRSLRRPARPQSADGQFAARSDGVRQAVRVDGGLTRASMPQGTLTLKHLQRFRAEAKKHGNASGVISPMILPAYTRKNQVVLSDEC